MKEKSAYQLEVEAKTEHLLGTVWYAVDYRTFTLITLGPLQRWHSEKDALHFTCLADGAGQVRWWPWFEDKKVNKGEIVFKEKADAMACLTELLQQEIAKHQRIVAHHEKLLAALQAETAAAEAVPA